MPEEFLIVKNLTKEFLRGIPVINNISFTVKEGGSFGILGKSGSGKSALMHAIRGTREYEPTHGQVIYRIACCPKCSWVEYPSKVGAPCPKCGSTMEFREINYWEECKKKTPIYHSIYNRISIMLQRTFALFGEYPALQNIRNILSKSGYPGREVDARALWLLSMVKMVHRATHLARDLSGGEKQRIAFAMSLAREPLLFLADEPTGTLDPITAEAVHEVMLRAVKDEGLTLIVTSHWPLAVKELSSEAILLEDGLATLHSTSAEVADAFLGKLGEYKVERRELKNPLVRVKDCVKYYYTFDRGVVHAVDGVSFKINEGEIFGLVGVSGSGKTTLAHMMVGLKPVTKGKIFVRMGEDWVDISIPGPEERGRATKYMDCLHQEYVLIPHKTVLDNIISAIKYEIIDEMKTKKAYDALKAVNFTDEEIDYILYKFPDEISEGERHRVAIARTLIKEPNIVLLDEPTGTADPLTRMEIVRSIKKARDELGQTYLIISHDVDFIEAVCDRAALMRGGKIVTIGDPKEVVETMKKIEKPME